MILMSVSSCSRSGFLNKEIREALEVLEEQIESRPFLIPVRLNNCEPSHTELSALQRVDMFPNWSAGLRQILKALYAVAPTAKIAKQEIRAFVQVKVRSVDNVSAFVETVLKIPNVISIDVIVGPIDFMVIVEAPTHEELHKTVDAVAKLREVASTEVNVAIPTRVRSGIKALKSRR